MLFRLLRQTCAAALLLSLAAPLGSAAGSEVGVELGALRHVEDLAADRDF